MNNEIQKIYDNIAMHAFQNYVISRKNDDNEFEDFRLAEIEIYMIDEKNDIDDIFIHRNERQLKFQEEYEHYSGFDICLGDNKNLYCGILVRGIMNNNTKIYGPGRVKYNHKDRKKTPIEITVKYQEIDENKLYFSDEIIDHDIILKNIIFKLPRVNLANTTCSKNLKLNELEKLDKYMNLKARYIRIDNEEFHKQLNTPPEEPREIFNALIRYKQRNIK